MRELPGRADTPVHLRDAQRPVLCRQAPDFNLRGAFDGGQHHHVVAGVGLHHLLREAAVAEEPPEGGQSILGELRAVGRGTAEWRHQGEVRRERDKFTVAGEIAAHQGVVGAFGHRGELLGGQLRRGAVGVRHGAGCAE